MRLPLDKALVILRGQKVLKVDKFDYTLHPDSKKLVPCKAVEHIPLRSKSGKPATVKHIPVPNPEPEAQPQEEKASSETTTQTNPVPIQREPQNTTPDIEEVDVCDIFEITGGR